MGNRNIQSSHESYDRSPGSGDALLADFGLARLVDKIAAITGTSTAFAGSTRFMAPELLLPPEREYDERDIEKETPRTTRSDVYAFGCLILQVGSPVDSKHMQIDTLMMAISVDLYRRTAIQPSHY